MVFEKIEDFKFNISNFEGPLDLLLHLIAKNKKDIVPNTVRFESDINCYILTGPNSGGKTIFINSLAAAQYYFQLGMPIPAKKHLYLSVMQYLRYPQKSKQT